VEQNKEYIIKSESKREIYEVSKFWFVFIKISTKILFLAIALFISYQLYDKCLYEECNDFVVGYFSIIGLCCFGQLGLEPEKLVNFSLTK